MDTPTRVFYVDHKWKQQDGFWQWECIECGELCRTRRTTRGGFVYAMREPDDTRGQLCVVIENGWRE